MTIRTVLLDDDPLSVSAAEETLGEYEDVELAGSFTESSKLLAFLRNHDAELLFLDIELKEESGFDIAKRVKEEFPRLLVVFLTGHSAYAMDSFEYSPVYFLTKPIRKEKMDRALSIVHEKLEQKNKKDDTKIMFRCPGGYEIVPVSEMLYIERVGRKNILYTEKRQIQLTLYTISEIESMLAGYGFFKCYQSFIISLDRVTRIYEESRLNYMAELTGTDKKIPVSRSSYTLLKQELRRREISLL